MGAPPTDYRLPPTVSPDGPLAQWVQSLPAVECARMDVGNTLDPASRIERTGDHALGQIEILQALLHRFARLTRRAFQAGLAGHWPQRDRLLAVRAATNAMLPEIGLEPILEPNDPRYERRFIEIARTVLRTTPWRDERLISALFAQSLPPWTAGGLCLAYPDGADDNGHALSVAETVASCLTHTVMQWGSCTDTARKELLLLIGAMALYRGRASAHLAWTRMNSMRLSARERAAVGGSVAVAYGHSFMSLQSRAPQKTPIALDPSGYGFHAFPRFAYHSTDALRGAMASYYATQGEYFRQAGDLARAVASTLQAIDIDPTYSATYVNLGIALTMQGDDASAEAAYADAARRDPRNINARVGLCDVRLRLGAVEEAEHDCVRAIAMDTEDPIAQVNMGHVLRTQHRWTEAETHYRTALRLIPDLPSAIAGLQAMGKSIE